VSRVVVNQKFAVPTIVALDGPMEILTLVVLTNTRDVQVQSTGSLHHLKFTAEIAGIFSHPTMQQPLDRRCCPHCCRCPAPFHPVSVDNSDDETTASTVSTATEADDLRESDEEFVQLDSETEHSAEDYHDQTTMSEGSSEHWDDDLADDGNDHDGDDLDDDDHAADDSVDNDHGQGTQESLGNGPVDVSQVLEATSMHESPLASLSAVLHSLDVHKSDAANHARGARDDEADA